MEHPWRVEIWGVRGSAPAPSAQFLEYGGNTPCISVDVGHTMVALDAGSGLTALGNRMVREGRRRADILIGHLHMDHVMGLFSFPLLYDPAADVRLYGPPGFGEALRRLAAPPWWPVGLAECRAQVEFCEVQPGQPLDIAGLSVSTLAGNHPGGCLYYRLQGAGRSLTYALDCELSGDMAPRLAAFAQGADLLIWDASFAPGALKPGWGHSTWEQGVALGRAAGAKRVLMTHYSPDYTDEFLRGQEELARKEDPRCQFAREGMEILL